MKKALIAMSGGIDSSVTAFLMKQKGYECTGITFRMFDKTDKLFGFDIEDADKDIRDAENVCKTVGIPFMEYDASEEFRKYVINNFVSVYEKGGTPNPCVECNRHIKFRLLSEIADKLGFDITVTGHYADIGYENGRYYIKKAADDKKDQSYVLYSLTQEQLSKLCFPLSQITKEQAREIAEANNFVNAKKGDSQDICFIPDGDYASFIKRLTNKTYPNGKFIDTEGNVLGKHKGLINYTVGQRKGLGIALGYPAYVKQKDIRSNTVTLSTDELLYEKEIIADNFNFMAVDGFNKPVRCVAKIRYAHKGSDATAYQINENTVKIVFDSPQRAPTDGQSVVLYDNDKVLGGGLINTKEKY